MRFLLVASVFVIPCVRSGSLLRQTERHDRVLPLLLHEILLEVHHSAGWLCKSVVENCKTASTSQPCHPFDWQLLLFFQALLIMSLVKFSALKYDGSYVYPWWGYAIGIFLAFLSILPVPLCSFYAIANTPGSLRQVVTHSVWSVNGLHSQWYTN